MNKTIIDEEIYWDKSKVIISRTDTSGTILYMNDIFEKVSEYNKIELIGEPHNIIRHPDMPKVIFKKLWESLKKGENYHAIIKNLTRSGRYYWVITDFVIERNENAEIIGYTGRRKAISKEIINQIAPLYKSLLEIEKIKGEKASELFFDSYLQEEIKMNYDEFVLDLFKNELDLVKEETAEEKVKPNENSKKDKKNLINRFFFSSYSS